MSRLLVVLSLAILAASPLSCGASQDTDPGQPIVVEAPAEEAEEPDQGQDEDDGDGEDEGEEPELVLSEDTCTTDEDCVPSGCCHAASCVGQSNAPSCTDTMCTSECRYGTLDCGGACLCHEGRCAARLSVAPQMLPRE